jgi:PPOX class probable F420-dependent enzyme
MDDKVRAFLERNHAAIMVTTKPDGTAHVARVGVGLVDGDLESSGTKGRKRTEHLRRDPRATLAVIDADNAWSWLGLETTVTIFDGDDGAERNLALYRVLAGEPDDVAGYLAAMRSEQRLIYRFTILRAYGQY